MVLGKTQALHTLSLSKLTPMVKSIKTLLSFKKQGNLVNISWKRLIRDTIDKLAHYVSWRHIDISMSKTLIIFDRSLKRFQL